MARSPLRYPGGKGKITPLIKEIVENTQESDIFIEPFAGGAGVALDLLLSGVVKDIVLNDYDTGIYSFWRAVKEEPEALIDRIQDAELNISEWRRQKEIYDTQKEYSIDLAFAAFYLNRTCHSGKLISTPMGGYRQVGKYMMDSRFNRAKLIERVEDIARYSDHITVYNNDISEFISDVLPHYPASAFVFLDPPYWGQGRRLYKVYFTPVRHAEVASQIKEEVTQPWVITYDDVPEITQLYADYPQRRFTLNYSLTTKKVGTELMIFKSEDLIPDTERLQ